MTTTRTAALAAAAALALLAALPARAGAAGDADGKAAGGKAEAYRTEPGAEPLKGAASSSDGPRMEAGTTYLDHLGPTGTRYYTVRLDGKSTAHLSAVIAPKPGARTASDDGLEMALLATDGTECDSTTAGFADDTGRPMTTTLTRWIKEGVGCQDADVYNLRLKRVSAGTSDPSPWPVELRYQKEPGLKKRQPTTAPDYSGLDDEKFPAPGGKVARRRGGLGFGDATGLSTGGWRDRVAPGETRYFRVPVDWGQTLFAEADFGTTKVKDADVTSSEGVSLRLYGPAYDTVDSEWSDYAAASPASTSARTPPVRYVNRNVTDDENAAADVAGWYYLAVTADSDIAGSAVGAVPFVLRVTVEGEPHGAPAYDGDAAGAGFGVTDDDREAAAKGQTLAQVQDSDTKTTIAYAGLGAGAALLLGLGGWTLIARRRAGAPAAGGPAAGGYGPPPGGQQR